MARGCLGGRVNLDARMGMHFIHPAPPPRPSSPTHTHLVTLYTPPARRPSSRLHPSATLARLAAPHRPHARVARGAARGASAPEARLPATPGASKCVGVESEAVRAWVRRKETAHTPPPSELSGAPCHHHHHPCLGRPRPLRRRSHRHGMRRLSRPGTAPRRPRPARVDDALIPRALRRPPPLNSPPATRPASSCAWRLRMRGPRLPWCGWRTRGRRPSRLNRWAT